LSGTYGLAQDVNGAQLCKDSSISTGWVHNNGAVLLNDEKT
jgi:hypothetical protein